MGAYTIGSLYDWEPMLWEPILCKPIRWETILWEPTRVGAHIIGSLYYGGAYTIGSLYDWEPIRLGAYAMGAYAM